MNTTPHRMTWFQWAQAVHRILSGDGLYIDGPDFNVIDREPWGPLFRDGLRPRAAVDRLKGNTMAKRTRPDTGEQLELIDVDHPADKAIRRAASAIRENDRQRQEVQAEGDRLREKLKAVMHEHKIKHWIKDDYDIALRPAGEKVSVRKRASGGEDEE